MATPDFSGLSVLVVDDVRSVRLILITLLRGLGVQQLAEASDGKEALRQIELRRCDLIITDLLMSPMDGIEFMRRLRRLPSRRNASLPVLMISGHGDNSKIKQAIDAGVSGFLLKPIVPSVFISKIKAVLEKPSQIIETDTYCGPNRRHRATRVSNGRRKMIDSV